VRPLAALDRGPGDPAEHGAEDRRLLAGVGLLLEPVCGAQHRTPVPAGGHQRLVDRRR